MGYDPFLMTHTPDRPTLKTRYVPANRVEDRSSGFVGIPPTPFAQREPVRGRDALTDDIGEESLYHSNIWLELFYFHDSQ